MGYRPFGMENAQQRSDRRSLALHVAILRRLREAPELWDVPLHNLDRWQEQNGEEALAHEIWREILTTRTREEIAKLLLSRSAHSTFLRSSTPFVGIINQDERKQIFERYETLYLRWMEKTLLRANLEV
ncbi:hypothetical protein [Pelotalea chapellei]|uniref:Uncharacterized protein n=1 Tax=Pelotalea chapellei TaxID=44671 RepID=A0ABS5UD96_9BACT|nr:hypothetical protein [Pelotalea chapellei]MBT1073614.1 hypothetical protein [Pelotalea chapellei]